MAIKGQKSEKDIAQKGESMLEAIMPSNEACFGNISDPCTLE
jgi:hypothetical protein